MSDEREDIRGLPPIGTVEWARRYARTYWTVGKEPQSQRAFTMLLRALNLREEEVAFLRETLHLGTELDNHHNAAMCPYCTPDPAQREKRLDFEAALSTTTDSANDE